MNILLLGSGGREHAFVWKLKQSPLCKALYVAPGNAGTALDATNVDIEATDIAGLIKFAKADEFKCKQCGAFHGGLYSTRICLDCWKKGHR